MSHKCHKLHNQVGGCGVPHLPRPPSFIKLIIKVESIQDFSAAGEDLTSRCCCDLLRAPVPGCWSRRTGDLGPILLNQACLALPAASQVMAPLLRASAYTPAKCKLTDVLRFWEVGYRPTQWECRYMTNQCIFALLPLEKQPSQRVCNSLQRPSKSDLLFGVRSMLQVARFALRSTRSSR